MILKEFSLPFPETDCSVKNNYQGLLCLCACRMHMIRANPEHDQFMKKLVDLGFGHGSSKLEPWLGSNN